MTTENKILLVICTILIVFRLPTLFNLPFDYKLGLNEVNKMMLNISSLWIITLAHLLRNNKSIPVLVATIAGLLLIPAGTFLFQIFNWQFTFYLVAAGALIPIIVYLYPYEEITREKGLYALKFGWLILYAIHILFAINHWPGKQFISILIILYPLVLIVGLMRKKTFANKT